ncbi:Phenylalanine--tRNA ligase alpha subunit A, partial [Paragonimus heterotremus]
TEIVYELTNEGQDVAKNGSHEFRVYSAVPACGISQNILMDELPNAKIGLSKALAARWLKIVKDPTNGPKIYRAIEHVDDSVSCLLSKFNAKEQTLSEAQKTEFKKRKLLTEVKRTSYVIQKGPSFSLNVGKEETDLSSEMIARRVFYGVYWHVLCWIFSRVLAGAWKTSCFKAYNFNALGASLPAGHLHPLLRVRAEFCKILTDMGFSEMPTNNYVECSFWNFDSLFQPQQHPARDAHDTFFISDPATTDLIKTAPADYIQRVQTVHSQGSFGSRGYQSDWLPSEAEKNLLRTHTTAVSARMLYALAKQNPVVPVRYFSIDRVFRNETLDATHLAEFHQVEGLVADYGLSLGHLKAVIRAFFSKLGLTKLRLHKWVEIGNSGIFRPEMLRPMGLPEGLTVIAWGLSLERPTMIRYGYKNIRDLIGPKIDLNMVYNAPLCRMEKF